jgi:DNA-binding NarL/FixJ family response regulator
MTGRETAMLLEGAIGGDAVTILIADDHPLFRDALQQVIAQAFDAPQVQEASTLDEAMQAAQGTDFDLLLLDINMPGMNGFNGLIALRNTVPATPIVVVSADEDRQTVQQALTLGASGFIPKSMAKDGMVQGLRDVVLDGKVFMPLDLSDDNTPSMIVDDQFQQGYAALTAQQRKVLEMLVMGKSNKVIAFELSIAESTVKAHVSAILRKLRVNSRTQAVLNASKMLGTVRAMPSL